jgi:ankyrin repeat protein
MLALNPQEQECLKALNTVDMDDCRAELNELHPPLAGSCRWILSDEKHRNWIRDDRLILLCITGHLGIGKSILMSYLVDNINSLVENITPPNLEKVSIGYFFCFDTDGRREGQAILRSLLLQILYQRHDLIRHATARCVKRGPRQWRFPDLLDILKDIMLDPVTGTIIFLIDALDECEQAAIVQILGISHYLAQLALPPSNRIKVLIASRPISEITERLRDTTSLILLDDDPEVKNVERDIKLFVQDRLNSWKSKNLWPTDFRKALEENILRRAEGNFRWVSLVIQRMRASRQDRHSLKQIVDDSSDMDGLYRRMLAEIEPENRNFAAKTLRILAGSSRALTTEELPTALAVTLNDRTLTSVDENSDMDIEKTLMHVLGPLIRISNSKVYLVHQDFKKFLYKLSGEEEEKSNVLGSDLGEEFGITPEMANLELATACIAFLNLEDFDGQNIVNEDADEFFEFLGAIEDDSVFLDEPEANSSAVKSAILAKPEDPMGSFYEYAACNWGIHLRASGPSLPQELRDATVSLMQQNTARLCNWADTYRRSSKNWEVLPKKLDPLIIAAFFGLTQFAIDILESGTIEMQENSRAHALTWACRLGFADFAKILLDHGTPVTGALIDNRSPLSWACAGGYIDIVKILIEKADTIQINTCDGGGRSPLSVAVGAGNFAIVKLLMARKDVNVNMVDRDGWSPVFWAIGVKSQEDLKMMKDLISDSRVNIGLRDRSGRTILSWAAIEGDCDTLNILLQSSRRQEVGDLLNDQGDKCDGRTPLSLAAHNGHLEAVRILCQNQLSGPRLIKDKFGKNAFILAADRNYTQIIKVLAQSYPDDIDVKDNSQRTALSSAIWAGTNNAETVRTLLRLGGDRVDVNTKSFSGMTPLMYAAECGRLDLVRILVEEGGADMTLSEGSEAGINKVRLSVEKQISCLKESRSRGVVK